MDRAWRGDVLSPGLRAFYRPCRACYGDSSPPAGEPVVRSRGTLGETFHRPVGDVDLSGYVEHTGVLNALDDLDREG